MKVRALETLEMGITKGKIYEVLGTEKKLGEEMYALVDDEEDGAYLYEKDLFEVVDEAAG